jgi:aryl-alcohol dehydrogenase-like predicted oxidoreductase
MAWLLAQGEHVVPIPGTKRVSRVEENCAADAVTLTSEQVERLTNLPIASGDHHASQQMLMLERS